MQNRITVLLIISIALNLYGICCDSLFLNYLGGVLFAYTFGYSDGMKSIREELSSLKDQLQEFKDKNFPTNN